MTGKPVLHLSLSCLLILSGSLCGMTRGGGGGGGGLALRQHCDLT